MRELCCAQCTIGVHYARRLNRAYCLVSTCEQRRKGKDLKNRGGRSNAFTLRFRHPWIDWIDKDHVVVAVVVCCCCWIVIRKTITTRKWVTRIMPFAREAYATLSLEHTPTKTNQKNLRDKSRKNGGPFSCWNSFSRILSSENRDDFFMPTEFLKLSFDAHRSIE